MLPKIETTHPNSTALDMRSDLEALKMLLVGQQDAVRAVAQALPPISDAAHAMAQTVRSGGKLIYGAAGSSALACLADGLELQGTFGIDANRIRFLMAGGIPVDANMPGHAEDDVAAADAMAEVIASGDIVITVTASGNTPYTCRIAQIAQRRNAVNICIANNADAMIFEYADVEIYLPTPPEIISESTRLGANTSQKITLNMMSSLMGVHLGHVYGGLMVNLRADNDKLRARAEAIVMQITGCRIATARDCLGRAKGRAKEAVLLVSQVPSLDEAIEILNETEGNLRTALNLINTSE